MVEIARLRELPADEFAHMVTDSSSVGRIIDLHFVPGRRHATDENVQKLDASLEAWKNNLPNDMAYSSDDGTDCVWTALLHLAYK